MPTNASSTGEQPRNAPKERTGPAADLQPEASSDESGRDEGMPPRTPTASESAMKQEHKTPNETGSTR